MKRISVAMISYQGAKYIEEQLDTILATLGDEDEVIVQMTDLQTARERYLSVTR